MQNETSFAKDALLTIPTVVHVYSPHLSLALIKEGQYQYGKEASPQKRWTKIAQ